MKLLVNLLLPGDSKASLMAYDLHALGLNTCKDLEDMLLKRVGDRFDKQDLELLRVVVSGWSCRNWAGNANLDAVGSIVLEPSPPDSHWIEGFRLLSAASAEGVTYTKDDNLHAVALEQGLTEIVKPLECRVTLSERPMPPSVRAVGHLDGVATLDEAVKPSDSVKDIKRNNSNHNLAPGASPATATGAAKAVTRWKAVLSAHIMPILLACVDHGLHHSLISISYALCESSGLLCRTALRRFSCSWQCSRLREPQRHRPPTDQLL